MKLELKDLEDNLIEVFSSTCLYIAKVILEFTSIARSFISLLIGSSTITVLGDKEDSGYCFNFAAKLSITNFVPSNVFI